MIGITTRQCSAWALPSLLALNLALTAGCAGKTTTTTTTTRHPAAVQGSNCYAKALPSAGTGGLAWAPTLSMARKKSMVNCIRYAGRSGGTPNTCQVVKAECKK